MPQIEEYHNSHFVFKIIATNLKGENSVLEENKYFI